MLAEMRIRSADLRWLMFFGLVIAAWAAVYAMALPADLLDTADVYGADFWIALCTVPPGVAGLPKVLLMWLIMSVAMMTPTLVPALRTFGDLMSGNAAEPGDFWKLISGYLLVWAGFSGIAAAGQVTLASAGLLAPNGSSLFPLLTAAILIVAGLYQFSPIKDACQSACMAPFAFFMNHWSEGPWRMGLRMGIVCLGCCWALMLLAFVGGTMNILFMGLATLAMTLEKLPQIGRALSRPLGGALVAAGAVLALNALS
ncbi:MAG: DUF2182 domain-containing protein [Pseudomonadota bacterium]